MAPSSTLLLRRNKIEASAGPAGFNRRIVMTKFESLAHSWLQLADELERAEVLLERLKAHIGRRVRASNPPWCGDALPCLDLQAQIKSAQDEWPPYTIHPSSRALSLASLHAFPTNAA